MKTPTQYLTDAEAKLNIEGHYHPRGLEAIENAIKTAIEDAVKETEERLKEEEGIMSCVVVHDPLPQYFETYIQDFLKAGFKLYGSPFVALNGQICQLLIRKGQKNDETKTKA